MRVVGFCLLVCLSVFSSPAFAVPVSFDFSTSSTTNEYFDALHYSRGGLSLDIFSDISGAQVSQKIGGLGVKVMGDKDTTLDGSSGFDSLTFQFSEKVTLLEVQFAFFEKYDEFSLLAEDTEVNTDIPLDTGLIALSLSADKFVFGVTDAGDDYRISSIVVDSSAPVPTPEPSTWLLLGSGLFGLLCWRRWKC